MNNIHGAAASTSTCSSRKGSGYRRPTTRPDFLLANDRWSQIINLQLRPRRPGLHDRLVRQATQCHHNDANGHDRTNGRIFKIAYDKIASR